MKDSPIQLGDALHEAREVFVLSGAGLSVASGIPDFRSPGGLWERYPPQVYATIGSFHSDPRAFWQLQHELIPALQAVSPNPAHHALAALESAGVAMTIATQNIDGLHQSAGSKNVLELHGGKDWLVCLSCAREQALQDVVLKPPEPPLCPACEAPLKPKVVLFGETLPAKVLNAAFDAAARCDLCLVLGTSAVVEPAASLPFVASEAGAKLFEINLEETPLSMSGRLHWFFQRRVEDVLPEALARFLERRQSAGAP